MFSAAATGESGKLKKKRDHTSDGRPLQSFGGLLKSLCAQ